MFEKALKIVEEKLEEKLQIPPEDFLFYLWTDIKTEFEELKNWNLEKFEKIVKKELKERNWDIYNFRSIKNEPITNLFKKVLNLIAKEENLKISNDSLSRILNAVRKQYSLGGKLAAGVYPPAAFHEREKWFLPDDLGDSNSCFHQGRGNEGNVFWLIREYELYKRAFFVVFHFQSSNKEGWGRCWAYRVDNALYATNFYSKHFEIKDEGFKYPLVRLLRRLFDLSGNIKFATGKESPLPIYLNDDGLIIYEPSSFKNSQEVADAIGELESVCLWCGDKKKVRELNRWTEPVPYQGREVTGLIICDGCKERLENSATCIDCGELYDVEEMLPIGNRYVCQDCFRRNWVYCSRCHDPFRREYSVSTSDGRILCKDCAVRIGKICDVCGEFFYNNDNRIKTYRINAGYSMDTIYLCDRCASKQLRTYQCECGEEVYFLVRDFKIDRYLRDMVRLNNCYDCYRKRRQELYDSLFRNERQLPLFDDPVIQILLMPD